MNLKIFAFLLALFAAEVFGSCDPQKCPQIPKHYEELACKPIIKDGECCPASFDCKHLDARDKNKCYYQGKDFKDRDQVGREMLGAACIGAAHCMSSGSFIHAHIDCAEFFGPPLQEGCVRQYARDSCCSVGTVCGEELKKLSTCVFEGKTYREGERMFPSDGQFNNCYKCFCTKGFDNTTLVPINKDCDKASCSMELLEADSIRKKCVPIYPKGACCPYDWRCPSKNDAIIPADNKSANGTTSEKCKFGKLEFNIGDSLSPGENKCSKCTCKIPPMLDCLYTPSC